jgi:hypothetical protein
MSIFTVLDEISGKRVQVCALGHRSCTLRGMGDVPDDGLDWEDRRSELIRKEFLVACSVWATCA